MRRFVYIREIKQSRIDTDMEMKTPTLQVNLDLDPLQADHQLQQALHLNASRDSLLKTTNTNTTPTSRKHARSGSYVSDSADSFSVSEVSGRFDDADEPDETYYSPAHSVKRRRSNDWPAQRSQGQGQGQDDEGSRRYNENSFTRRWRFNHGNNARGSPRAANSSKNAAAAAALPRGGRRSRFVEGTMNDSVSEKPPSIFLRDDWHAQEGAAKGATASHNNHNKSSGIFRFGKAIASAFNPFSGWNASDVWKGGSTSAEDQRPLPENDDVVRVQQAYEELKKSGFKGTVKGAYTQGAQAHSSTLPEQTWKAIQAKMDYNPPTTTDRHSRQMSGSSQETATGTGSIRTPLTDLRKTKSSLGISSAREHAEAPELLRKQKSRKDLLRQTKLMKKVSNLEDKLQRARRELRELRGEHEDEQEGGVEEPVPVRTMCQEKPYQGCLPKKFVPGALPTLPSERCLDGQNQVVEEPAAAPLQSLSPNISRENNNTPNSTKSKDTKQPSSTLIADNNNNSPSLKRKSPDPESLEVPKIEPAQQNNEEEQQQQEEEEEQPSTTSTPTTKIRRSKLQKRGKSDSPGSVERKQQDHLEADDPTDATPRRKPRYLKPTSPNSSPSARRSPAGRPSAPCLRMKRERPDLRSESDVDDSDDEQGSDGDAMDCDPNTPSNDNTQHPLYLQGQHHLNPDQDPSTITALPNTNTNINTNADTNASPTPSRKDRKARYEYIPPVPPLPKDLAATAAKVDKRLAKELGRRKSVRTQVQQQAAKAQSHLQAGIDKERDGGRQVKKQQVEMQAPTTPGKMPGKGQGKKNGKGQEAKEFEWPEEIF